MSRCAIGLGSNVGDRLTHLNAALDGLRAVATIVAVSPVYETDPVGGPEQGPFLNAVVLIDTAHPPIELLRALLIIERARGRVRDTKWGPRTLDLDLLLCGGEAIDVAGLSVPHPRLRERRFVLEPLRDVWPDARMPDGSPVEPVTADVTTQPIRCLDVTLGDTERTGT